MKLPDYVIEIIGRLEAAGFEAYAVGGCVRDCLLGRPCSDYDVTTSAKPDEVKAALAPVPVIETGIQHGTVTAVLDKNVCEITTFRQDLSYSDHRRPDAVLFSKNIKDDLSRRDFTINALAYNQKSGLIDLFDGKKDLEGGIIRAVGDADARIREDALRALRAIRFCSQLGFEIEKNTAQAVLKNRELLSFVSKERIYSELKKTILGKNAERALSGFREIIFFVLPALRAPHFDSTLCALSRLPEDFAVKFAALFYSLGAPCAVQALHSLKAEKKTVSEVKTLLSFSPLKENLNRAETKILLLQMGEEMFFKLLALECAFAHEQRASKLSQAKRAAESIIQSGECYKISDLKIGGKELLELKIEPKEIGGILQRLVLSVINGETPNEPTKLLEKAKQL